jgi:hypothetical protein
VRRLNNGLAVADPVEARAAKVDPVVAFVARAVLVVEDLVEVAKVEALVIFFVDCKAVLVVKIGGDGSKRCAVTLVACGIKCRT